MDELAKHPPTKVEKPAYPNYHQESTTSKNSSAATPK